jgi:hypothetical protein
MADIASLLPSLLVYALLIFAAFILIRQIRKILRGETGCSGCSSGGCSNKMSGSSCCGGSEHHKKDELKTIKK